MLFSQNDLSRDGGVGSEAHESIVNELILQYAKNGLDIKAAQVGKIL